MLEAIYHPSYVPDKNWYKLQLLLWDKIYRIVPYSVKDNFGPAHIAEIWNIPEEHVPIIDDTIPSFRYLEERKSAIINQLRVMSETKNTSFLDASHFYLNTAKVPDWIGEKLKDYGLRSMETYDEWGAEHYLVREDASNFIMSCIAHNLSIRRGMSTLTNNKLSCFTTFGNQIGKVGEEKPSGDNLNSFISGVFNIMVPSNLSKLDFPDVLEIRTEYDELRKAARNVLEVISNEFKLNEIIDNKKAEEVVTHSLNEFNSRVEKFKKGIWRRAFKDWRVQCIATLLGTIGGFIAGGPVAALAFTGGGGGITLLNQIAGKEEVSDIDKSIQYFNRINEKIKMKSFNKELINYRRAVFENYYL